MTEELLTGLALMVAGVVAYLSRNIKLGSVANRAKFIEKAKAAGNYTIGKYVDSKRLLGNRESSNLVYRSDTLKVKYCYQVNGIEYFKNLQFQSPGKIFIDFPVDVTVYYDPKNPKKAVCPNEATKSMQHGLAA